MKRILLMILVADYMLCIACNSSDSGENNKKEMVADLKAPQPDLSHTDSIELYFFPEPGNQKLFNRKFISDSNLINQLVSYIQTDTIRQLPCLNEYKLFFYRDGQVYKTVYASVSDTCRYFAWIVNGKTYFTPLKDSAMALLTRQHF